MRTTVSQNPAYIPGLLFYKIPTDMKPGHIDISAYDYRLPEERIAKFPLPERDSSKLLLWNGGSISQTVFSDLSRILPAGSLLVFNNTKVIRARLLMRKPTGAAIEIFCLEPHRPADYERSLAATGRCSWKCIIGNSKRWKTGRLGMPFEVAGTGYTLEAEKDAEENGTVTFHWDAPVTFGELLEILGRIPIPPYLGRDSQEIDNTRYQTVYSRLDGSVAAPTAGLHFSKSLIDGLQVKGVSLAEVTLHVGAGTFLPVKSDDATEHEMHTEHFTVTTDTIEKLLTAGGKTIAVGTTTVRTLESLSVLGYRVRSTGDPDTATPVGQWEAYSIPEKLDGKELLKPLLDYLKDREMLAVQASTKIMITPGYRFRVTEGLITNFHQPHSTLLLLVSAFTANRWREIYDYALSNGFRFLSYGDSSLLLR